MERFPTLTELSNISKRHYRIFDSFDSKKKPEATYYMVLFYAVECRLKAALFRTCRRCVIKYPKRGNPLYELLMSHRLDDLIKELKLPNIGTCPKVKIRDGSEKHVANDVHLLWRYGFEMDEDTEEKFVRWLKGVYTKLEKSGI